MLEDHSGLRVPGSSTGPLVTRAESPPMVPFGVSASNVLAVADVRRQAGGQIRQVEVGLGRPGVVEQVKVAWSRRR